MDRELFDTIVIGAGPVGSCAARQLASYGYKVAVLEEHERIGEPMQCTGIIGVECFERFNLSTGSVLREARSSKFFSPSGKIIRLQSEKPQAYVVDRSALDKQLAVAAINKGANYFTSCRVNSIVVMADRVVIATEASDTFESCTAVIASGFYSKLAQRLGLEKFKDFMTGAQAEVNIKDGSTIEEIEIYLDQELAPGFFAWLVPTAPQRALAGLFARRTPQKYLEKFLKQLYDQGRITSQDAAITPGGIPLKPLSKTYCKRVIVVGDAAGQVKPTTGGGVYYGMICAQLAAETLKNAFENDDFSQRSMSGYQKAWQKEIGRELRDGYIARRIYEKCSNHVIDQMFDLSLKKGLHEIINESTNIAFDWHSKAFFEIIKQAVPRLFNP
jgi:geranylgeranyl reductase family protein